MWVARIALSVLSGLLLGFSQHADSPVSFYGLLVLVGFVPLLWATKNLKLSHLFGLACITTALQYGIIADWVYVAFRGFAGFSVPLSAFLFGLFILLSSLLASSAFALSFYLVRRTQWPLALLLAAALSVVEYLRIFIPFGGLPTGSIAHSLAAVPALVQTASLIGASGLVFLIVLFNVLLFDVLFGISNDKRLPRFACVAICALAVGTLGYGTKRLYFQGPKGKMVRVALLQADTSHDGPGKTPLHYSEVFPIVRALQNEAVKAGAQIVIWPEGDYPLTISSNQKSLFPFAEPAPIQIVAAVVMEKAGVWHNSALLVDSQFNIKGHYDKTHLMPFGESIPALFRYWTSSTAKNGGGLTPGFSKKPLLATLSGIGDIHIGFNICWETIFPEIARTFVDNGADLMITTGDEESLGNSSAHHETLLTNILRAVENARSFARVIDAGTSAFIDSRGRVTHATPLFKRALAVGDVELNHETTVYAMEGDIVPQASLTFLVAALLLSLKSSRRKQ